ncbi:MAG: acetate and sugar kinases/Hsc70/actin family protein [Planctomycetaceae bacterium]
MTTPSIKLLVIDAGHTRVKFASCDCEEVNQLPEVEHFAAPMIGDAMPWAEIINWFSESDEKLTAVVTGSNPKAVEAVLANWPRDLPSPQQLDRSTPLPIEVDVAEPNKVGVDRLLTAIAANQLRGEKQTAFIVDSGTAVTVDAVNSKGVFLGGAILPGVRMGAQALHRYTDTLPEIDASKLFDQPPHAIGNQTTAAIESGLYWGHVGAVRELLFRQRDRLTRIDKSKDRTPLVLLTGGASPLLVPHFSTAQHLPHLALQGLARVALRRGKE